jgi:F-type H+/Na+-transporting ATPase subunit alpha
VKVPHIRQWERDLLEYLEASHPQVLKDIKAKKALDDDITSRLKAAIAAFKPLFEAD